MKTLSLPITGISPEKPANDSNNHPNQGRPTNGEESFLKTMERDAVNDNRELQKDVSEILPTTTGEFLEEMRATIQQHLQEIAMMEKAATKTQQTAETDNDEHVEIPSGDHPYRSDLIKVPKPAMYPFHDWFI